VMPLPLEVSEADLKTSLADAALALRHLDSENRMVDRCAVYLEQLAGVSEALSESPIFLFQPQASNLFS
jgi:hypothetical protein